MPVKPNREYRNFSDLTLSLSGEEETPKYRVQGRAVVFDTPTCLYECGEKKYFEVIDRNAFDGLIITMGGK